MKQRASLRLHFLKNIQSLLSPEGTPWAEHSEAHGQKTLPVPTRKGLNRRQVGPLYGRSSTPARVGSFSSSPDANPGWRLTARHPGLFVFVPSGDPVTLESLTYNAFQPR